MGARDWYFAWIADEATPFDPVAHMVVHVPQVSVDFVEEEGKDAVLCTIHRDALGSGAYTGRSWAWLSFETPNGVLHPVLRMRLDKKPLGQDDGIAELSFTALPSDFAERRAAGLVPYKVLPAFDPILVDRDKLDDPREILDGHQRVVHFDRVTQAFSAPSIVGVGLPKRTFGMGDIVGFGDEGGITVRQVQNPLAGVQINLTAEWLQRYDGPLDATNAILSLFGSGKVETLDGETLESSWFKAGAAINGASGYVVTRSRLSEVSAPMGATTRMGPVSGQKGRYSYVDDGADADARTMSMPVRFYDIELALHYSIEQKRVETVSILLLNKGASAGDGEIRTLDLKCQDVTYDGVTPPFVGLAAYSVGDVVRVGATTWRSLTNHVAKDNFAADSYRIESGVIVAQWERLANDASAIGGPDRASYFHTERGKQTMRSAVLRGMRLLLESERCVEVSFVVPFEDVVGMSTAYVAEVEVDDDLVPGGWAEGKVTMFAVSDPSRDSFPRATITIECCPSLGEAPAPGAIDVPYTAEPWDRVTLQDFSAQLPLPLPAAGGAAQVVNDPEQQLEFIQANDYRRNVVGRDDKIANDPKTLVKQVPTEAILNLVDLTPTDELALTIVVENSGWSGPAQIALPE